MIGTGVENRLMGEALELAARADFTTSPNPMVGALVVRDGEIVGRGFTAPPGGPHAEVTALAEAGEAARGATLVVTLEPCSHQGRTGPCVQAVVDAGIARCLVGVADPNPKVAGAGLERLRDAGVEVVVGIEEQAARRLNEFYLRWVTSGMPFVTAKFAVSLDGHIATSAGESKWITGDEARARAHLLRHRHDAVLVGANTVVRDDPNLTTRLADRPGRQPLRVVLDSRLRVPLEARIFQGDLGRVLVATSDAARGDRLADFERAGITVAVVPARDGRVALRDVLRHLAEREQISVLLEGGSRIHGSAFDDGLVDRVVAFVAPRIIGGAEAPAAVGGHGAERLADAAQLTDVEVERLGADIVVTGYCVREAAPDGGH